MAVPSGFLIMTAVWTQIGRLQSGNDTADQQPQEQKLPISLLISDKAIKLTAGGASNDYPLTRSPEGKLDWSSSSSN